MTGGRFVQSTANSFLKVSALFQTVNRSVFRDGSVLRRTFWAGKPKQLAKTGENAPQG